MKLPQSLFSLVALLPLLSGCVSTSSYVLVGTRHPQTDPSEVKLYLHPPASYEEIALVAADSRNSFARSAQGQMDAAIANLKSEAASLGADGILLSSTGNEYAGSFGSGMGVGVGSSSINAGLGGPITVLWNSSTISLPVYIKTAAGLAIRVKRR